MHGNLVSKKEMCGCLCIPVSAVDKPHNYCEWKVQKQKIRKGETKKLNGSTKMTCFRKVVFRNYKYVKIL